jgi:hypothetical protein
VNLAYRWFCILGIEDAIPDHSAFSRARNERFREGDVFRLVFERVVEACLAAGLVGGEGFAVDASLIQADGNKQRSIAGQDWRRNRDPARSSRAVKEYQAATLMSEPRSPNGCSPWVRPFPPRLPPRVASPCSVASQVMASSDFSSTYMLGVRLVALPCQVPLQCKAQAQDPRASLEGATNSSKRKRRREGQGTGICFAQTQSSSRSSCKSSPCRVVRRI